MKSRNWQGWRKYTGHGPGHSPLSLRPSAFLHESDCEEERPGPAVRVGMRDIVQDIESLLAEVSIPEPTDPPTPPDPEAEALKLEKRRKHRDKMRRLRAAKRPDWQSPAPNNHQKNEKLHRYYRSITKV